MNRREFLETVAAAAVVPNLSDVGPVRARPVSGARRCSTCITICVLNLPPTSGISTASASRRPIS